MSIFGKLLSQNTEEKQDEAKEKKPERMVIKIVKPKEETNSNLVSKNTNVDDSKSFEYDEKKTNINYDENIQYNKNIEEDKNVEYDKTVEENKIVEENEKIKEYGKVEDVKNKSIDQAFQLKEIKKEKEKEGAKVLSFDGNTNFEKLYADATIKPTKDNIERVIETIGKMSKLIPNGQTDVVRAAVRTTLETTGFNINNIKEDGNNKITAVKKYREFVDGEVNRYVNDKKNAIAELEKQIEQYKMDIQDKKSMLLSKNKQLEVEIHQMAYAIEFLSIEENKEQ